MAQLHSNAVYEPVTTCFNKLENFLHHKKVSVKILQVIRWFIDWMQYVMTTCSKWQIKLIIKCYILFRLIYSVLGGLSTSQSEKSFRDLRNAPSEDYNKEDDWIILFITATLKKDCLYLNESVLFYWGEIHALGPIYQIKIHGFKCWR